MRTTLPAQSRFPQSLARALALIALAYGALYLTWRIASTLNPDAWPLTLLLLLAEALGLINAGLFTFMVWDVGQKHRFELLPGRTVDVFVPTYNEDVEVIQATLAGCNSIVYPHTTYVLDDGRRPEIAELANRMGCQYLTRQDNRHAKAGNINAALARTTGEFVVIVDADTVPQPMFVDHTIGYFTDERVALVQLPQEFYNLDSVQHRGRGRPWEAWHEQALFFRVIQAGKNRWNSAFWCGSPSIVRRAALQDIGGVATASVTEDLHTSLRLHAKGWKTVYHAEPLAYGIAPQTLRAFSVQRLRWAQGTMQILRSRENPIVMPGLTLAQRLNYIASTFTYFDAFQKLVYLLVPAAVLLTGIQPLRVGGGDYLLHAVPFLALATLANFALGRGAFRLVAIEQYNILKMFLFIWASSELAWPRRLRFKVTPKSTDQGVRAGERRALSVHFVVLSVILVSIGVGLLNLVWGFGLQRDTGLVLLTMVWAAANAVLLASGVVMVLRRLYSRRDYRFPVQLSTMLGLRTGQVLAGHTEDLSRQGCAVTTQTPVAIGSRVSLRIPTQGDPLRISGLVLRCTALANDEYRLGLSLDARSPEEEDRLVQYLFVVAAHNQSRGADEKLAPPASPVEDPELAKAA